jgi:hypothetical protein
MVVHAAGRVGLWIGGVVGGVLGSIAAAALGRARGWIAPAQFWGAAIGGTVGFLLAAFVAAKTLGSPVGPVLSTLLIGLGSLIGATLRRSAVR